ncbi:MAG TPA: hypothetical protein ENG99_01185 [bacterium]|nr:hypothetical protein [bacterium]
MVITYYGVSCLKVQSGETVLAFDPPSKEFPAKDYELKIPRFQADIVLISHSQHKDHNGHSTLAGKPSILDGPGEYEIKGIQIAGIKSFHDEVSGERNGLNTIYTLVFEDISICHMGDFGEKELESETEEAIGKVDILFVPISITDKSNKIVMDPQNAAKIVTQLEPKVVIPMHYHKDKKLLKKFLDEFGNGAVKPIEKLVIKKKDLEGKKAEVVVLSNV